MNRILGFCSLLLLLNTACKKDDAPADRLEPTGLLGEWVLQKTVVNGIEDLMAPLNDHFLSLTPDDAPDDLQGLFRSQSPWHNTTGTFTLREEKQELLFAYEGKERLYTFLQVENSLELSYWEEGNTIVEFWQRTD